MLMFMEFVNQRDVAKRTAAVQDKARAIAGAGPKAAVGYKSQAEIQLNKDAQQDRFTDRNTEINTRLKLRKLSFK